VGPAVVNPDRVREGWSPDGNGPHRGPQEPAPSHSGAELAAAVALRLLPGVGDVRFLRLVEGFGGPVAAWEAPEQAFRREAGQAAGDGRGGAALRAAAQVVRRCREAGIRILPSGGLGYPPPLLQLPDPPALLFVRGEGPVAVPRSVALVGSRRPSPVGRRIAHRLARDLAVEGVEVVSGLALGVDGAAHEGALAGGGRTTAVLGCGPDLVHPRGHRELLLRILAADGLAVTELLPGERPSPHHFPRRNRLLAALTRAAVVVEAGERSGALITARHAVELGREVMAVPGSLENPTSVGSNRLLRDGAHPVLDALDILAALGWSDPDRGRGGEDPPAPPPGLEGDGEVVWRVLGSVPRGVDDLSVATGLPPERLLALLSVMEMRGQVRAVPGGRFIRDGG